MAACSDGKRRQSGPGRRFLSWQFDSSRRGGQIWKLLPLAVLLNDCLSRKTRFKNADMGVNNPKIPQRLKTEPRSESIWVEIRVLSFVEDEFFILFVCLFVLHWPRGASALMRLICAVGT